MPCRLQRHRPGSPPQVRGKPDGRRVSYAKYRITPAGAGKTISLSRERHMQRDHPRRCGENRRKSTAIWNFTGSPPQVRGKLPFWFRVFLPFRITPAGAGKTKPPNHNLTAYRDHPRRCGENKRLEPKFEHPRGSPPQVRGKRRDGIGLFRHDRITPAGAGKTYNH